MGYYIDLTKISIEEYKSILKSADLLPSRMILKDNIDEHFRLLAKQGIKHVDDLLTALGTKKKLEHFVSRSQMDENYLSVLVREAKSYRPKPNNIKDFPDTPADTVSTLEGLGIKTTLQLYNKILTPKHRHALSIQTKIAPEAILRLSKLSDLSRIKWVNHTFAYVLFEAGYDTTSKVATASFHDLYETVKQLNAEREIYKGHIGLNDMKRCVEAAKNVPLDIIY